MEDVIERHKIEELRRVLVIGIGDIVDHLIGHYLQFFIVVPYLVEQTQVLFRHGGLQLVHHGIGIVSPLAAQFNGGKAIDRRIGLVVHSDKAHHILARPVRLEAGLLSDPVGTLAGNGTL